MVTDRRDLRDLGHRLRLLLFTVPRRVAFRPDRGKLPAIYVCLFEFFHEANFAGAPPPVTMLARVLPVLRFLTSCVANRRRVYALIDARHVRDLDLGHLSRLVRWFVATMAVEAASFALPRLALEPGAVGVALLGAMGVVTVFVTLAVRDVVTVMVDVSPVFAAVAARLDRLVMPALAFTTFYALLVAIFSCLYRIADLTTPVPQFLMHGFAIAPPSEPYSSSL